MFYRLVSTALLMMPVAALALPSPIILNQQNVHQQEQEKARQKKLAPVGKDVQGSIATADRDQGVFVDRPGCLTVSEVVLENAHLFPHRLALQEIANRGIKHCLTVPNLRHLIALLENRIMKAGYITSRVSVPEQQAGEGRLTLNIEPGRVGKITLAQGSNDDIHIGSTFPLAPGKLLNLRAVEQGLENMQRIPDTDVAIRLYPGEETGTSNIEISRQQRKGWRTAFWLDDAGSRYTGRYQGGAAFYLDNPASLNDLFYFSWGQTLEYKPQRGSRNHALWYSVPYGYWSVNLYASASNYSQPLSDELSDHYYKGESRNASIQLSRMLHRDAEQKTSLSAQLSRYRYRYFLSDTEIDLQQKDITQLRLALSHRHYLQNKILDAALGLQRNVPWMGNRPTAEMRYNGYHADGRLMTVDLQAYIPFQLASLQLSYLPYFLLQYSPHDLVTQNQFSMGNRWSIRGFDGENSLTGNSGWFWSNTISLDLPQWQHQFYVGVDYGQLINQSESNAPGKHMAGGVIGLRGEQWATHYHLFAGLPLYKPDNYRTDSLTLGFNVQWEY
ncbi:ShlB/FhaC/HecB family hemolysin secretion/activation protein [Pantoea alhagi]|uniref:ShlB/FhaC/HecB family hemolysin secretion/activation protein n=1 Tax=Pantoea alhagi TaxID=1891675 RepID=UPI00202AF3BE|nr:ShlB/FhaC/HecB family hemolysin secretion/activation protein [Pantoea alhagi]URQ60270.1 ShlB/FhaC/HecB family hemolysin secretion/activation protein [Pantoea alhagi]